MATKDLKTGKRSGAWPTEPVGATAVSNGASGPRRPTRFRSLTLVGASPAYFGEGEPRGTLKIRVARMFEERRPDVLRPRSLDAAQGAAGLNQDPNLYTFLAHNDGRFIGSLSVRLDSTRGLAADELYRDETTALRDAGSRLCEFVNLSIDMNAVPKRGLACLFHSAYLFAGEIYACDYGVIESPARHVGAFCNGLGFEAIGEERRHPRITSHETLLGVHLKTVLDHMLALGGRPDKAAQETSLFPYGFSPEESAGVVRRLAGLAKETP